MGKNPVWKLSFNTYAFQEGLSGLSGFGFHTDLPSNGLVTVIYPLGLPSLFVMRHPDRPTDLAEFNLESNTTVLLSGEARWAFEHCVVPTKEILAAERLSDSIGRISLVLGCSPAGWNGLPVV